MPFFIHHQDCILLFYLPYHLHVIPRYLDGTMCTFPFFISMLLSCFNMFHYMLPLSLIFLCTHAPPVYDLPYYLLFAMCSLTCSSKLHNLAYPALLSPILYSITFSENFPSSLKINKYFTHFSCMSIHIVRHIDLHFVHSCHTTLMRLIALTTFIFLHISTHTCCVTSEVETLSQVLFTYNLVIHLLLIYASAMPVPWHLCHCSTITLRSPLYYFIPICISLRNLQFSTIPFYFTLTYVVVLH